MRKQGDRDQSFQFINGYVILILINNLNEAKSVTGYHQQLYTSNANHKTIENLLSPY
ncbi:MAG TPA: hypothetical protein VEV62_06940 [Parafilimonas sp.]|nr:hypothetical protein [Parafilimonas sp.]